MVFIWVIEYIELRIVNTGVIAVPSHVVCNHVDHKILSHISVCRSCRSNDRSTYHASLVQGTRQSLQVRCSPKVRVELVDLLWPETMVSRPIVRGTLYVLRDGGYPDSCKSHVLYVVQIVDDTLPCATAILSKITASRPAIVGSGITIGKKLVDRLSTPLFLGKGRSQSKVRVKKD